VGKARHLAGKQGIFCGDKITDFPTGSEPHSTEAWFRAEQSNGTVVGWGNEQAQGKVVMQFQSPPRVRMDCYFSEGNISTTGKLPMNEWIHVVHTYQKGEVRIYVNGALSAESKRGGGPLSIKRPARMWIGGWYNNFNFEGGIDEVRISNRVRSADWIKLQYENQKPQQTLVGPLVQPGKEFSVSPVKAEVAEGKSVLFTAKAGGAEKVSWMLLRDGMESTAAVDCFSYTFSAGRISGNTSATVRFKAVFPDGVKSIDVPVTIREDLPDPEFSLAAVAKWDGRSALELAPVVANQAVLLEKGVGTLQMKWDIQPIATIHEITDGKLRLLRAQNSGEMTVSLTISNGGAAITKSVKIAVEEPAKDAWVQREPADDEMPEDGQFYARDPGGDGSLFCRGKLTEPADEVFVRLFEGEKLLSTTKSKPGSALEFSVAAKLKPGLIRYRMEFGTVKQGQETIRHRAENLVCGDAFLLDGQSNTVATDWGPGEFKDTSDWIRTFGSMGGNPKAVRWGNAVRKGPEDKLVVGYWAVDLARHLVETQKVPICIINGAVGGTRVDQHQRNAANPTDLDTIYGRLLWRVQQARLTHGIRGILWHQGENDQGADGPDGGFGYENYRSYFISMAAGWKQDYPNVGHYYVFQIWPKACSMGFDGSDNRLREVQRQLPSAFSKLHLMSTLGIDPPGGCHYPAAGYAQFAKLISPLIERDFYSVVPKGSITPPNLLAASRTPSKPGEIELKFDQPVEWTASLAKNFYVNGKEAIVGGGSVSGNTVTLQLAAEAEVKTVTYLDSERWDPKNVLRGSNGIAALTFCEVPVAALP
jgi:hypothetical protein